MMCVKGCYDVEIYWVTRGMSSTTNALRPNLRALLVCVLGEVNQWDRS